MRYSVLAEETEDVCVGLFNAVETVDEEEGATESVT